MVKMNGWAKWAAIGIGVVGMLLAGQRAFDTADGKAAQACRENADVHPKVRQIETDVAVMQANVEHIRGTVDRIENKLDKQ